MDEQVKISDYELASRLYYFLWSIHADLQLLKIVRKNKLSQPEALHQELQRILDIMVLAFQTNRRKVASLMMAHSNGGFQKYNFLEINENYHFLSHHGNNPEKMNKLETITRFQVTLFNYFLQKLDAFKEGDSTLLDNSLILFESNL